MTDAEPPLSDEGIKGVSHILEGCADELGHILEFLEQRDVQPELIRDALETQGGIHIVRPVNHRATDSDDNSL